MKPLLVGELNPYGPDAHFALWSDPQGSAGWRLCHAILGLEQREYLRRFDRVNLCTGAWDPVHALEEAEKIVAERLVVIALGGRVARAFKVGFDPFAVTTRWLTHERGGKTEILVLPHPSGRCRLWNDPKNAERARSAVERLCRP